MSDRLFPHLIDVPCERVGCEATAGSPSLSVAIAYKVPTIPSDAHPLLHYLARAAEDIDREIARLAGKRAAVLVELRDKLAEWEAQQDRRARAIFDGAPP